MAFASHKVALLPKIPCSGDAYPLFGKGDKFFYNTPPKFWVIKSFFNKLALMYSLYALYFRSYQNKYFLIYYSSWVHSSEFKILAVVFFFYIACGPFFADRYRNHKNCKNKQLNPHKGSATWLVPDTVLTAVDCRSKPTRAKKWQKFKRPQVEQWRHESKVQFHSLHIRQALG